MCKAEERSYTRPIQVQFAQYPESVVRSYFGHSKAVWVRCSTHGSQRPTIETRQSAFSYVDWFAQPVCPTCGKEAKLVLIETPSKPRGSKPTECNGACLAGKRSCSCRCGGRCHGAGICQCNQAPQLALL